MPRHRFYQLILFILFIHYFFSSRNINGNWRPGEMAPHTEHLGETLCQILRKIEYVNLSANIIDCWWKSRRQSNSYNSLENKKRLYNVCPLKELELLRYPPSPIGEMKSRKNSIQNNYFLGNTTLGVELHSTNFLFRVLLHLYLPNVACNKKHFPFFHWVTTYRSISGFRPHPENVCIRKIIRNPQSFFNSFRVTVGNIKFDLHG